MTTVKEPRQPRCPRLIHSCHRFRRSPTMGSSRIATPVRSWARMAPWTGSACRNSTRRACSAVCWTGRPGSFRFGPYGIDHPTTRIYVPGTNVIETTWKTPTGWIVIRDALTMGPYDTDDCVTPHTRPPMDWDASHTFVRTATCIEGRVEVEMVCEPAFDYRTHTAAWKLENGRRQATGSGAGVTIVLRSDIKIGIEGHRSAAGTSFPRETRSTAHCHGRRSGDAGGRDGGSSSHRCDSGVLAAMAFHSPHPGP